MEKITLGEGMPQLFNMMVPMSISDHLSLRVLNQMKNSAMFLQFRSITKVIVLVLKENHVILGRETVIETLTAKPVSNVVKETTSSNFQDFLALKNLRERKESTKKVMVTIATILISTKKPPNVTANGLIQLQFKSNTWVIVLVPKENHAISVRETVTETQIVNMVSNVARETNLRSFLVSQDSIRREKEKTVLVTETFVMIQNTMLNQQLSKLPKILVVGRKTNNRKLPNKLKKNVIQLQFRSITKVIAHAQKVNHVISVRETVTKTLIARLVSNVAKETTSSNFQDYLASKNLRERKESTKKVTVTIATILISTKKQPNVTANGLIQLQYKSNTWVIVLVPKENHVISARETVTETQIVNMVSNVARETNLRSFLVSQDSIRREKEKTVLVTETFVMIQNTMLNQQLSKLPKILVVGQKTNNRKLLKNLKKNVIQLQFRSITKVIVHALKKTMRYR